MPGFACSAVVLVLQCIGLYNAGLASAVQPPIPSTPGTPGGNASRTGQDPCQDWPAPGSTGTRWAFGTNYRVMTKLVMSPDGETVFVGSGDEHLYALYSTIATSPRRRRHSKTQKRWDFYTPEGTVSSPAVSADGQVVFIGAGHNVYAVPNGDGGQLWKFFAQGAVAGGPAVSESLKTVFVGSYDKNLYAINAANGDLRWNRSLTSSVASSPTVSLDQKTVFVGSNDGNLYAVNAADGTVRWKSATGGGMLSTPAMSSDQEMVIVGCYKNLCAFNAADGTLRWNFTTGDEVWSSPVVSSDNQAVFVGSNDQNLYAVNVADGILRWKLDTGGGVSGSPALSLDQKTVFVGSGSGFMYAVNTADGNVSWFFKTGGGFPSSPAVSLDQKTVFIGNQGGTVYAICIPNSTGTAGPAHSPEKSIIDTGDRVLAMEALAVAAEIAPTEAFAGTAGTTCCMVDSDGPYPYPCTVGEACTCPFYYGGESGCQGSGISSTGATLCKGACVCEANAAPAQEGKLAPPPCTDDESWHEDGGQSCDGYRKFFAKSGEQVDCSEQRFPDNRLHQHCPKLCGDCKDHQGSQPMLI